MIKIFIDEFIMSSSVRLSFNFKHNEKSHPRKRKIFYLMTVKLIFIVQKTRSSDISKTITSFFIISKKIVFKTSVRNLVLFT